jgi:signal transduction histidine kinase/membrane-associated phospholipid phosphatase
MLFVFNQFKNHLEAELFNSLESRARMTAEMILIHEDELKPAPEHKNPQAIQINDIGNTSIYDRTLNRVYSLISSAPLTPMPALKAIRQAGESKFVLEPYKAYGYVYTSRKNNEYVVVAEDKPDYSKLVQLKNILFISTLFTSLIVAMGGWFFAGQSMRPVNRIIHEVNDILPNDLSKRLALNDNQDELSQLIITFNSLLDRIENAFKTEKSFISNVSHELKNPLAAIRTQIQFAANKERSTPEYKNILTSLQEDINGMSNTIEKLLQLARVHSNLAPVQLAPLRLDELVYQSKDNVVSAQPAYKINIEMIHLPPDEEGMIVMGNESLLKLAIMNLMENACKFSYDHSATTVIDFSNPENIKVSVQNFGKTIPKTDWEKIFKPFHRSQTNSYIKGSGIGLSLVKSIIDLHSLQIDVSSDEINGTSFTLSFLTNPKSIGPETNHPQKVRNESSFVVVLLLMIGTLFFFTSCKPNQDAFSNDVHTRQVIKTWYQQYLNLNHYTDGYRPPVSARTFAYIGLGAWEAGAVKYEQALSLSSHFNGLALPSFASKKFDLDACLNAMYYTFANLFYPHANMQIKGTIKDLYSSTKNENEHKDDTALINSSDRYGRALANAVFSYASRDSTGHLAYLYNYDQTYKIEDKPGIWKPTGSDIMPALLPHWGTSRTFLDNTLSIHVNPPIEYSEAENSDFFAQAWEIYTISKSITPEKKWIAEFWSDDFHGVTYCAASRWISIALQAVDLKKDMDPLIELELFAKIGFALNDAGVKAWGIKYNFKVERPETYIQRMIQPNWHSIHDSPSFPAYPSGHSIFGASVAGVLTNIFGEDFKMTDHSHEGRKEFMSDPRTFKSFKEMASENALSRMYMGVHYRSDCEEGLRLGSLISEEANKLKMIKPGSVFNR